MKSSAIILLILFLLISLGIASVLVLKPVIFFGKAASSNSNSSLENSYLFASPLQAKANGQEIIRVTVFLLNSQGLGIGNQTISLKTHSNITINPLQPVTDDSGKAVFDLSSTVPGSYPVSALFSTKQLPQTASVFFY